ncbi:hypothetical protein AMECASPLE_005174 [Ameca splendens]|uniref:Uncharacterized protein n=1 Tax=Ameca splendens TaxID=208324 RepID=A0ABV0YX14_9TELE
MFPPQKPNTEREDEGGSTALFPVQLCLRKYSHYGGVHVKSKEGVWFRSRSCIFYFSAPSLSPSVYLNGVRFCSRGRNNAWVGQSYVSGDGDRSQRSRFNDDIEPELEGLEDKLQAALE